MTAYKSIELQQQRDEARAEADRLRAEVERLRKYAPSAEVEALLARSSLGTDEAEAARDSVSPDAGRLVVRLSEVMAERDNLRVTLGAVAERVEEIAEWTPMNSHDAGSVYAFSSVDDLLDDVRDILAAVPVSLADVRAECGSCGYPETKHPVPWRPDFVTPREVVDHG